MMYKIYVGLKENSELKYLFTEDFETEEDAIIEAEFAMMQHFYIRMGTPGYKDWDDFEKEALDKMDKYPDKSIEDIVDEILECEIKKVMNYKIIKYDDFDSVEEEE